uniref:Keratin, type II cytoskeletal 8 n=1 Tax=Otolemur garnettii TaxID=30611 RepID=H0XJA1_OTOGA
QEKLKLEAERWSWSPSWKGVLRQLYEEETCEPQSYISDTSVVLSMDNSHSLDGIISEVPAQYEEITNCNRAQAESWQTKYEELQVQAGKHRDDLGVRRRRTGTSADSRLRSEALKGQRASLEAAAEDAEQRGELAVKDTTTKLADMSQQLREHQDLMNIKLALDMEITTYCKLPEGEQSRLESGMQNMSIHIKITSGYSGGLGLAYRCLTSSGLSSGLSSFQPSFGSGGGSCSFSHTSARAKVTKIETHDRKLVSESSDILPK